MNNLYEIDNTRKRDNIINHLLVAGINQEDILEGVASIHRDWFLPDDLKSVADSDDFIFYDDNNFLLDMATMAHMISLGDFKKGDSVLVYPSGIGYSLVVLSKFVSKIVAIEENESLLEKSKQILTQLSIDNVDFYCGSLNSFNLGNRYNKVFLNGAFADIDSLISNISLDNVELIGVKRKNNIANIVSIKKLGNQIIEKVGRHTSTPYINGFEEKKSFIF